MSGEARSAELSDLRRGQTVAWCDHARHDLLTAHGVFNAEHPDILHAAHRAQHLLDFLRLNFLSRDVDERRGASGEDEALTGVKTSEITGEETPVGESLVGRSVPGVAGRHGIARHVHASASIGALCCLSGRSVIGNARQRPADRGHLLDIRRVVERDTSTFGRAIEGVNLHAERSSEGARHDRIERRAGADERLEYGRPGDGVRIAGKVGKHERHAREHPRAVGRRVGVQLLRDERFAQDDWGALDEQWDHQIAEAVGV